MISIIHPSSIGITYGIDNIIKALQDNTENLLTVIKITKEQSSDGTNTYAWAALFREKGTVGQLTALINQWGTNFGPSSGGAGSSGYCKIMSYIEDNDISILEISWNDISSEMRNGIERTETVHELYKTWEKLIMEILQGELYQLLPSMNYPLNEKWKLKIKQQIA